MEPRAKAPSVQLDLTGPPERVGQASDELFLANRAGDREVVPSRVRELKDQLRDSEYQA